MKPDASKRIMIYTVHEDRDIRKKPIWTPVCCVNVYIYTVFSRVCGVTTPQIPDYLAAWVLEDFNISLDFSRSSHLYILDALVTDRYEKLYDLIVVSQIIKTTVSWVRLWFNKHMLKEIKKENIDEYKKLQAAS